MVTPIFYVRLPQAKSHSRIESQQPVPKEEAQAFPTHPINYPNLLKFLA
jgi:hypothetical protein